MKASMTNTHEWTGVCVTMRLRVCLYTAACANLVMRHAGVLARALACVRSPAWLRGCALVASLALVAIGSFVLLRTAHGVSEMMKTQLSQQ
eukprot:6638281-Alexandrium_andersonii.AAC.1